MLYIVKIIVDDYIYILMGIMENEAEKLSVY